MDLYEKYVNKISNDLNKICEDTDLSIFISRDEIGCGNKGFQECVNGLNNVFEKKNMDFEACHLSKEVAININEEIMISKKI